MTDETNAEWTCVLCGAEPCVCGLPRQSETKPTNVVTPAEARALRERDEARAIVRQARLLLEQPVYRALEQLLYSLPDDPAANLPTLSDAEAALLRSNDLLRSCHAVAEREGRDTNWPPLDSQLLKELEAQHALTNRIRAALAEEASDG